MTGTRDGAIERAEKYFDTGGFLADLQRRVAIPTTSQEQDSMPALQEYVAAAQSGPEDLEKYLATYVRGSEESYRGAIGADRLTRLAGWSRSADAWQELFT